MPAYKRQLEDESNNIIYPITTAEAVVDSDNVDLQTRVDNAIYVGAGSVGTLTPWVDTSDIVNGAVTSDKIDFTTSGFQYQAGTYTLSGIYVAGRTGNSSNQNKIQFSIPTSKTFPTGATVTFTPSDAYGVEVFGPNGVLFSRGSGTQSHTSSSFSSNVTFWNGLDCDITVSTSDVTLPNNIMVVLKIAGTITIS